MSRETYRGYVISDYPADGVPMVAVREQGKMCNAWSQAGTGDHQVGRDWIDELLDGCRRSPDEWAQEVQSLRDENELLRMAVKAAKGRPRERFIGMLMIEGEVTEETVKAAFKRQAKVWHPDQGGDAVVFRQLQEAREVLLGDLEGS